MIRVKFNKVITTINPSDCTVFVEIWIDIKFANQYEMVATKWFHKKLKSAKQSTDLIKIFVASKPKMHELRLLGNIKLTYSFSIYSSRILKCLKRKARNIENTQKLFS